MMVKTRKIQVTLDEVRYQELSAIAAREGRKLAALVRESIDEYCIAPEIQRRKQKALKQLLALEPTPVPEDYQRWKHQYSDLKTELQREES